MDTPVKTPKVKTAKTPKPAPVKGGVGSITPAPEAPVTPDADGVLDLLASLALQDVASDTGKKERFLATGKLWAAEKAKHEAKQPHIPIAIFAVARTPAEVAGAKVVKWSPRRIQQSTEAYTLSLLDPVAAEKWQNPEQATKAVNLHNRAEKEKAEKAKMQAMAEPDRLAKLAADAALEKSKMQDDLLKAMAVDAMVGGTVGGIETLAIKGLNLIGDDPDFAVLAFTRLGRLIADMYEQLSPGDTRTSCYGLVVDAVEDLLDVGGAP